ncbi:MAG TPA: L-threonylcarbamoyladenylate synthase [Pyrinomonadaceae bacterium]
MIIADGLEARQRAAHVIAAGGVVGFRTDTLYGLGADPFNREALRRLNDLKGRDGKPILVVICDAAQAERFIGHRSELFCAISERHWPGALTLVVNAGTQVPEELTAGSGTIGLRLPDDEGVRAFIRACGGALTATSANLAGEPPAHTAEEVARSFPSKIDLIIDGGPAPGDKPSTVLDVSGKEARLIREGAVSWQALEETLRSFGGGS